MYYYIGTQIRGYQSSSSSQNATTLCKKPVITEKLKSMYQNKEHIFGTSARTKVERDTPEYQLVKIEPCLEDSQGGNLTLNANHDRHTHRKKERKTRPWVKKPNTSSSAHPTIEIGIHIFGPFFSFCFPHFERRHRDVWRARSTSLVTARIR